MFVVTGKSLRYNRFLERAHELADFPTIFQKRIDKTLKCKHPAWLDDNLIKVTERDVENHEADVRETLRKLENAGYRLNPQKCRFFKKKSNGWAKISTNNKTTTARQIRSNNKNKDTE